MQPEVTMNCLRCGYDLSHTPTNAACPECGLAAERSAVASTHPDDAPPAWVRSIALGTFLLVISYLVPLGLGLVEGLKFELDQYDLGSPALLLALLVATVGVHWMANLMLARDDRPRPFTWRSAANRWALRLLPLGPVLAVAMIVVFAIASMRAGPFYAMALSSRLNHWVPLILGLAGLVVINQTLTFFRLRWLAQRLGRPHLAEHTGIVASGLGASLLAVALGALPAMAAIHTASLWFVLLVAVPWALAALFSWWSVGLLCLICPLFFVSAGHARAKWLAADATRPQPG
jgi:hypothetical protein